MRRLLGFGMVAVMLLLLIGAAPTMAAERSAISIDATTTFDDVPDSFTATGLPGCASGTVENGPVNFAFTPAVNVFAGYKVFTCDDADNGFVLRLNARFGDWGSVGTWSVVDAWGSVARMTGAGGITGAPIDNGIFDQYRGTLTFR